MPELKRVYGSHKNQGLVLIGIHSDPNLKGRDDIVRSMKLPYPICEDSFAGSQLGVTGSTYHIEGYPTVFVIDRKGRVAAVDPPDLEGEVKTLLKK